MYLLFAQYAKTYVYWNAWGEGQVSSSHKQQKYKLAHMMQGKSIDKYI